MIFKSQIEGLDHNGTARGSKASIESRRERGQSRCVPCCMGTDFVSNPIYLMEAKGHALSTETPNRTF